MAEVAEKKSIELPTKVREPKAVNPHTLLIYAPPKTGKTTIVSQLKDSLILELERNGGDYVSGIILDIDKPSDFNRALDAIEVSEKKYKYLIIDTLTQLDIWSEIVGTYNFMKKSQGKKFNREGDIPNGQMIMHTDPRFESVHELPNGFGYVHSRNQMIDWYERIITLADHIIFICHVKETMIESKNGDTVESKDINLTGRVKSIIASRVDAIGILSRKDGKGYLNFSNEYKIVSGGRCRHLDGEILISEKQPDGSIKTFWENIYKK